MGFVYTEITLKNPTDVTNAGNGLIKEQDIRQITVNAMVDTGTSTLVINEELRQKLGLNVRREKQITLADESKVQCQRTDAVEIHWKDRESALCPIVIPGTKKVLLGAIALESMDLMVDPTRLEVTGAHGDEEVYYA